MVKQTAASAAALSKPGADFFLTKFWTQILENPECKHIISWDPSGVYLIVYDSEALMSEIKDKGVCKQKDYDSFARQLRIYRWSRVRIADDGTTPWPSDARVWRHETLTRDSDIEEVAVITRNAPPKLNRAQKEAAAAAEAAAREAGESSGNASNTGDQRSNDIAVIDPTLQSGDIPVTGDTAGRAHDAKDNHPPYPNSQHGARAAIKSNAAPLAKLIPYSRHQAPRTYNKANAMPSVPSVLPPMPQYVVNPPDFKEDIYMPTAAALRAAALDPDTFDRLPWEQFVIVSTVPNKTILSPQPNPASALSQNVEVPVPSAAQNEPSIAAEVSLFDPALPT